MLSNVPSLEKLRALKKFDLSGTLLEKIPGGMECLTNLRYLRMNKCGEMVFPSGILSKLSLLQVFVLEDRMYEDGRSTHIPITVEEKDVGCLRKLECMTCHFEDYSDLVKFLKSRDRSQLLKKYRLFVGQFDGDGFFNMMRTQVGMDYLTETSKTVCLSTMTIDRDGDFQVMLPKDIQQLIIYKCCDFSSLINHATELEVIRIWHCNSMECLVSSYNGIFSVLRKFDCYNCRSMKKLFPPMLLPNLVNLEEITVNECQKMEVIIGTRSNEEGVMDEESNDSNTKFSLTRLRRLTLWDLAELKSICSAKLVCISLQQIEIEDCQKLKRMPIFLPFLENGQPSPLPSLETIEVSGCKKMEEIIRTISDEEGVMDEESNDSNSKFNLPKLKRLGLRNLPELESFCNAKLICNSLERINIYSCQKLKRMPNFLPLLENEQPSPLPSLESIDVSRCDKMEEIIRTRSNEEGAMGEESNPKFSLPKLRRPDLCNLPELESICSAKLICNSLQQIEIKNCQKLKRMPICLSLLENGKPSPPPSLRRINVNPKEWWDSVVEWEHITLRKSFVALYFFHETDSALNVEH